MERFGERLRTLRHNQGYSLDDLAQRTGISRAYLWKLEKKPDPNPSLDRLERLASALKTTVGELAGSTEPVPDDQIPHSLAKAKEEYDLSDADISDLARIRFRGGQPSDPEDWYMLFLQLKRSLGN